MMKEGWKRFLSSILAMAMAFTMVLGTGIGQETVKADETQTFTLYYYYEGTEQLYVNIWNWAAVSFGENVTTDSSWGWDHELAQMQAVSNNENWYSVDFVRNDASAADGFTLYAGTNKIVEYDNQWNNTSDYAAMVSGSYSAYAIKDAALYTDLSQAGLNIGSGDEETEDGIVITPSATTADAGSSVALSATVTYQGQKMTESELKNAGLTLNWWADSWNDHADGNKDAVVDSDTKNSAATSVQLPSAGTYYIICELCDPSEEPWTTLLSSCVKLTVTEPENSDAVEGELNIKKVEGLSDDFIMGMDISSVISLFDSGVTFKDYDGKTIRNVTDFCKFLADNGITHIRVRVWNDPYDSDGNGYGGGNNDVAKAKQIADACSAAGIKMLVDFHCSDLWTDPGKQYAPKAWEKYSVEQKADALKAFITDSLNQIDPDKDTVAMVQVGNETTSGFIGVEDQTEMCTLFSAGAEGVRAYNKDVKVVIHETNPEKGNVTKWAKILNDNSVDYDILATSYYPYWHGTLDNLKSEFKKVRETYGKDVMVAETSYAYTLDDSDGHQNTVRVGNNDTGGYITEPFNEQGQATAIRNLIAAVNEVGGLGVYYWEPAWITVGDITGLTGAALDAQVEANKKKWETCGSGWASSYASDYDAKDAGKWYGGSAVDNEAMFYPDGTPTPALHVWEYVKTGAVNTDVYLSSIGTQEELNATVRVGEACTLPETITVSYSSGDVQETVTWKAGDIAKMDLTKAGTYKVSGTVQLSANITAGAYQGKKSAAVTYTLTVKPENLITDAEDAGFEKGDSFVIGGSGISSIPATDDPYEGSKSMHWYSKDAAVTGTVTYDKEITLSEGTYTFEAVAQGAAGDQVSLNILDTEGNILFEGTPESMDGWKNWKTPAVTFTLKEETTVKLQIQVAIAAGGWGTADCLYLHVKETSASSNTASGTTSAPSAGNITITTNPDGTVTETKTEITENEAGKEVEVTVVTNKDADGNVTDSRVVSVIAEADKNTSVTVTVEKDAAGTVTDAIAEVTKRGVSSKKSVTTTISGAVVSQIAEAAGQADVEITYTVQTSAGKVLYTVAAEAEDLTVGSKLKVVAVDTKTQEYILVNAKTYQVSETGDVKLTLPSGNTYELVTTEQAKAIEKAILKTVKAKKSSVAVKAGKSVKFQMSSALNMDNVAKITYTSSKKSVATVSKSGKIKAKKAGTVTIKAKVTLNNGKTKTVTMKVKVK